MTYVVGISILFAQFSMFVYVLLRLDMVMRWRNPKLPLQNIKFITIFSYIEIKFIPFRWLSSQNYYYFCSCVALILFRIHIIENGDGGGLDGNEK